jgi:predicted AAA+ superfamily ATPase
MIKRHYWLKVIERAWRRKNVVWLSGVRRSGKTVLAQSLGRGVEYFDCELPHVRRQMEDPESFLEGLKGKRVVLDEIHRLQNPRGWKELRNEDWGLLWEHFVLNELQARFQTKRILYWRDKAGHEVDFVFAGRGNEGVLAVECKSSDSGRHLDGLQAFQRAYPKARLRVVVPDLKRPYRARAGMADIQWMSLEGLVQEIGKLFPGLYIPAK